MDSKVKYGVYTCLIWNSIIALNIVLRSYLVSDPLDLSSVGMKILFIVWSLVMFGVGYFARKDYLLKESVFVGRFDALPADEVKKLFRLDFFAKMVNVCFYVSIGAIPWFVLGYWGTVDNLVSYIVCAILFVIASGFYIIRIVLEKNMRNSMMRMDGSVRQ